MSSSIKSPYVYSLSSTVAPGIRARWAPIWARQQRAVAPDLAACGLSLMGFPLLQGPFFLDTSADLLLKPAHLLLKLTDEIYHTLRGEGAGENKCRTAGRDWGWNEKRNSNEWRWAWRRPDLSVDLVICSGMPSYISLSDRTKETLQIQILNPQKPFVLCKHCSEELMDEVAQEH